MISLKQYKSQVAAVQVQLGEAGGKVPLSEDYWVVEEIVSTIAVTEKGLSFVFGWKRPEP